MIMKKAHLIVIVITLCTPLFSSAGPIKDRIKNGLSAVKKAVVGTKNSIVDSIHQRKVDRVITNLQNHQSNVSKMKSDTDRDAQFLEEQKQRLQVKKRQLTELKKEDPNSSRYRLKAAKLEADIERTNNEIFRHNENVDRLDEAKAYLNILKHDHKKLLKQASEAVNKHQETVTKLKSSIQANKVYINKKRNDLEKLSRKLLTFEDERTTHLLEYKEKLKKFNKKSSKIEKQVAAHQADLSDLKDAEEKLRSAKTEQEKLQKFTQEPNSRNGLDTNSAGFTRDAASHRRSNPPVGSTREEELLPDPRSNSQLRTERLEGRSPAFLPDPRTQEEFLQQPRNNRRAVAHDETPVGRQPSGGIAWEIATDPSQAPRGRSPMESISPSINRARRSEMDGRPPTQRGSNRPNEHDERPLKRSEGRSPAFPPDPRTQEEFQQQARDNRRAVAHDEIPIEQSGRRYDSAGGVFTHNEPDERTIRPGSDSVSNLSLRESRSAGNDTAASKANPKARPYLLRAKDPVREYKERMKNARARRALTGEKAPASPNADGSDIDERVLKGSGGRSPRSIAGSASRSQPNSNRPATSARSSDFTPVEEEIRKNIKDDGSDNSDFRLLERAGQVKSVGPGGRSSKAAR